VFSAASGFNSCIMETSKSLISEEELIETVRRYSSLYDPADKYYHDILSKDNAWEEISAILKCPGKYQIIISISDYLIMYVYIRLTSNMIM
jgi:hypothetical protein